MKYLFFDIECSDGKAMCSFGYVLVDRDFHVLEKKDILINPEAIFHTGAWSKVKRETVKKAKGITLAYPKSDFIKSPKFFDVYGEIRMLLTNPEIKPIGYSSDNDARFIIWATERYKLPQIEYAFYDMQRAYREYKEQQSQPSLESALEEFNVDVTRFIPHRSDEDALQTMLVAKGLSQKLGLTLDELIEKYPTCQATVKNGKINFKHVKGSICDGERYNGSNNMARNRKVFTKRLLKAKPAKGKHLKLSGKKVCFSANFEDKMFAEMLILVDLIAKAGGKYVRRAHDANIYVEVASNKVCRRLKVIDEKIKRGQEVLKIDINEFLKLLGITYSELLSMGAEFRTAHIGKMIE